MKNNQEDLMIKNLQYQAMKNYDIHQKIKQEKGFLIHQDEETKQINHNGKDSKRASRILLLQAETYQHDSKFREQQHSEEKIQSKKIEKHHSESALSIYVHEYPQPCRQHLNNSITLNFTINFIISQIDRFEAYECNYLSFHIMHIYLQSQRLTLFVNNSQSSMGYHLFQLSLKKISKISKTKAQGIEENVCYDIIADCLKYYQHTFEEEYYLNKLKQYITKNEAFLSGFMPLYYEYFKTVATLSSLLPGAGISEVFSYLENIPNRIKQKRNFDQY